MWVMCVMPVNLISSEVLVYECRKWRGGTDGPCAALYYTGPVWPCFIQQSLDCLSMISWVWPSHPMKLHGSTAEKPDRFVRCTCQQFKEDIGNPLCLLKQLILWRTRYGQINEPGFVSWCFRCPVSSGKINVVLLSVISSPRNKICSRWKYS